MALRHAGSPVCPPEKLSRGEQDDILYSIVMAYRRVHREQDDPCLASYHPSPEMVLLDFRAALRLDDPVLDDLIAQGAHKRPWSK